jgi:hypothetical protein
MVLVGVAGSTVALHSRVNEDLLRLEQSRSLTLTPATVLSAASVQIMAVKAPEPVSPARRTRPAQVRCRPGGPGALRNPWSCAIRYRSGTQAHYRLVVQPNGYYSATGTGIIEGCCIKTPMLN